MNQIYPIAKLGNQALIINSDDLQFVGKKRAAEVKCVKIDFEHIKIEAVVELEKHLKFNPWEETNEFERNSIFLKIADKFSDDEIFEKIMEPLAGNLIKP